jgi:hypothetical protein
MKDDNVKNDEFGIDLKSFANPAFSALHVLVGVVVVARSSSTNFAS